MRQQSLFPHTPLFHGGELSLKKRKSLRPLARGRPIHLVLKSRQALKKHKHPINQEIHRLGDRFQIRIDDIAVAHDHIHLVIFIPSRKDYVRFIRSLTGLLARRLGKGLWSLLPFTRVGAWGRAYEELKNYLKKNREEAEGIRPYETRKDWYKRYRPRS